MGTFWRALTVKPWWAWAICHAGKDIENRTWPVPAKLRCCKTGMVAPGSPCDECGGTRFFDIEDEPHRVMIHAGASQFTHEAIGQMNIIARAHDLPSVYRGGFGVQGCYGDGGADPTDRVYSTLTGNEAHWKRRSDGVWENITTRSIVAVAKITRCTEEDYLSDPGEWAQFSKPGEKPIFHWHLDDVAVLDNPVPAKGRLGLWKPSTEIIRAVEAQL